MGAMKTGAQRAKNSKGADGNLTNRVVVASCAKLHAAVLYNDSGGDQWLHVFEGTAVPNNSAVPDLPPVKVPDGSTGFLDYGDSGRPMSSIVVVPSSTAASLTIAADVVALDVTYS